MTKYCLFILHPFVIIAEEISSPIKSSSYDVPSIILNYLVFTLEAIIAAQSPLHCHFSIGMQLNFAIIAQRSTVSYLLCARTSYARERASKVQLQQLATTDLISYKATRVRLVLFLISMQSIKQWQNGGG